VIVEVNRIGNSHQSGVRIPNDGCQFRHRHLKSAVTDYYPHFRFGARDLLESTFFDLWVEGEISNLRSPGSGHLYFTLKDRHSQVRCVFFNQWNRLLRYKPEDGLEVRVRGRVEVYPPHGNYQLLVETMEPLKVGDLQLAYEQQVKRLRAEGLFDPAHKRKLPLFPRRIGVITSPVGAAVRDVLQILERRHSNLDVLIAPARVQGEGAALTGRELAQWLNRDVDSMSGPALVPDAGH
jgi:exodeoxyribonuclease VII large subunit